MCYGYCCSILPFSIFFFCFSADLLQSSIHLHISNFMLLHQSLIGVIGIALDFM